MTSKLPPLVISKVKTPTQPGDKSSTARTNNETNWHIVDSNNIIRSPQANSPPPKKSNNIIFTSKNRYAPLASTSENENKNENESQHMDTEQPTEINYDTNIIKINLPPPIFIEAHL